MTGDGKKVPVSRRMLQRFGPMITRTKLGAPADHFPAAEYQPSARQLRRALRRVRAERAKRR